MTLALVSLVTIRVNECVQENDILKERRVAGRGYHKPRLGTDAVM
jgi:hypothetical protein